VNRYILILTLSRQDLLDRLLSPLYWESTEGAQTIILNQGGSKIKVSRKARVYNSETNLGCAGGRQHLVNQLLDTGLERDDQLVFLDDDVEVLDRTWLWKLCSPLAGEYSISGVDGRKITPDYLTEPDCIAPDYVSGGWAAFRADVFLDGCQFDVERFSPNYWEDCDIQFQARAIGKQIKCVGEIGLRHIHPPSEAATQLVAINRLKFMEKWDK
jgi:GT2 family glycosyltransferase